VIGLLLGTESSATSTVADVCEMIYSVSSDGRIVINDVDTNKIVALRTGLTKFIEKSTQCIVRLRVCIVAVYTAYSVVGWYAVSAHILDAHRYIHDDVAKMFRSNPLFLLLSPETPAPNAKQLPIQLFSSFPASTSSSCANTDFRLESSHLEKVALDEVTKRSMATKSSGIEVQNEAMMTSVQTLGEKIDIILNTLKEMQRGAIPVNHEVMRRANKIVRMLNTVNTIESQKQMSEQVDECLMVTYLSTGTKAAACISELSDAYSLLYSDRHLGNY
jgi:hypothetical protein